MQGCELMTVSHWTIAAKNLPMSNEWQPGQIINNFTTLNRDIKSVLGDF